MHEWALAEAVITAAQQIAEKEKLREIREVNIKIGELQQVEEDILRFALSQLKPASFKNATFHQKYYRKDNRKINSFHNLINLISDSQIIE